MLLQLPCNNNTPPFQVFKESSFGNVQGFKAFPQEPLVKVSWFRHLLVITLIEDERESGF